MTTFLTGRFGVVSRKSQLLILGRRCSFSGNRYQSQTGQRSDTPPPLLRRLLARWGSLLREHNVPITSHAHDRPAETRTNIGDRFRLDDGPSRTGVLKFAVRVVVIDQQRKAWALGGQGPLEHLAVSARVTCGQDWPAAELGLDIRPVAPAACPSRSSNK